MSTGQTGYTAGDVPPKFFMFFVVPQIIMWPSKSLGPSYQGGPLWCFPMEPFSEINLGVLGRRIGK